MTANLKAVLGLDSKPYRAGLNDAKKGNADFVSHLKTVAGAIGVAFSVGAIVNMGKALVKWASDVSTVAGNMGIATEQMMALNVAAAKGGLEVGDMQKMLARLQTELFRAAQGEETSAQKFEQMGLSIRDMIALDPVSMLQAVTKAAFDSGTPVALLAELFGERLGPRAIDALHALADDGLPAVSKAAADAADEIKRMGDEFAGSFEQFKQGASAAAGAVITGLKLYGKLASAFAGPVGGTKGWSIRNPFKSAKDEWMSGINEYVDTEMDKKKHRAESDQRTADELAKTLKKSEDEKLAKALKASAKELDSFFEAIDTSEKMVADELESFFGHIDELAKAQADKAEADRRAAIAATGDQMRSDLAAKQEQLAAVAANTRGSTVDRGAMARVGGFTGGGRAGYEVDSKAVRVAEESRQLLSDIKLLVSQIDLHRTLADGIF